MISRNSNKIKSDTERFSDTFNRIFVNQGNTLKIDKDKEFLVETNDTLDSVLKAVKKYRFSILSIKEKMNNNVFSFRNVKKWYTKLIIWALQSKHS